MNDLPEMNADVLRLVQLFGAQPDLRFPDLDAARLHAEVASLKERQRAVEVAESALAGASAEADDQNEALLKAAHKALAYLKVYAEGDERLMSQVAALTLPKPRRSLAPLPGGQPAEASPPRRRGRPPKVRPHELFPAEVEGVQASSVLG
jgi:multidrug efflux pump subunit AcrA (membrane-fusion protein)